MRKKNEQEMERAKVAKTARTLIRLKHSLAADEEINDLLPDRLEEMDAAYVRGAKSRAIEASIDRVLGVDGAGE